VTTEESDRYLLAVDGASRRVTSGVAATSSQGRADGKVELLRRYPGVLFIDAHEMGRASYFFPPNADPIYHEITDQSVDWINNVYGKAMQDEFRERAIPFFNYDIYDLFYMGYGDTVPSTGFGSAGMTFEKASGDPAPRRVLEQYLTQWTSLSAAASRKEQILAGWHDGWVEAERQGRAGELEPNEVVQPANTVQRQGRLRDAPARPRQGAGALPGGRQRGLLLLGLRRGGGGPGRNGRGQRRADRVRALGGVRLRAELPRVHRRRAPGRARARVLARYDARYRVYRTGRRTTYLIANPGEQVGDEHAYAPQLAASLRRAKVPVVMYRAP
ncbi:MAG: hypothetical protein ACRDK0_03245, partial [Solirubrobacteraceae bacterium]